MNAIEKRLRALEAAVGREGDTSWNGQVARMHARGENIPRIIVEPGETAEEVRLREGIPDGMPYIARIIIDPGTKVAAAELATPPADALEADSQDFDPKPRTRDPLPNGDRDSDDREAKYEPRQDPWM